MPEQHRIDFCILKQACVISLKALYLIFISCNILSPGMFNSEKMPKPMMPEVLHETAR